MDSEISERISEVPQLFHSGNKSTARLLQEMGFPEARAKLSVAAVEEHLRRIPGLAGLCLERATDQRMVGVWGIDCEEGVYRVQHYCDGQCLHLQDKVKACAE